MHEEHTISCGSLLIPKTTFGLLRKRRASSAQNSANCAVVAAVGSVVFPITLPDVGCDDGSLSASEFAVYQKVIAENLTYSACSCEGR